MARKKASVGLVAFLKGSTNPKKEMPGCANYDHRYGGCAFKDECLVEQGARCAYFEKAVLPTAAALGLQGVYEAYEESTDSGMLKRSQARVCPDCSGPVKPRQRYCEDCSRKRRQKTRRISQQRFRKKRRG